MDPGPTTAPPWATLKCTWLDSPWFQNHTFGDRQIARPHHLLQAPYQHLCLCQAAPGWWGAVFCGPCCTPIPSFPEAGYLTGWRQLQAQSSRFCRLGCWAGSPTARGCQRRSCTSEERPQAQALPSRSPLGWHRLLAPRRQGPRGHAQNGVASQQDMEFQDPLAPPGPRLESCQELRGPRRPPVPASPKAQVPAHSAASTQPPAPSPSRAAHTRDPPPGKGVLGHKSGPPPGPQRTGEGPCGLTVPPTGQGEATHQVLPTSITWRPPRGRPVGGQGPRGHLPPAAAIAVRLGLSPHLFGLLGSPAQSGTERPVER